MKRGFGGLLLVGLVCGVSACSLFEKEKASGPLPSGTIAENLVTATATVQKIDLSTRKVVLKGPEGNLVTLHVDERVKNLPQVRVGDLVNVSYYESLAYQVARPGEAAPGVTAAQQVATAKPGERPAGVGATAVTITTTITGIDKSKGTVTLTNADGDSVTIKARDPNNLNKVQVGDLVQITYSEALAVSVEPAAKK